VHLYAMSGFLERMTEGERRQYCKTLVDFTAPEQQKEMQREQVDE